MTVMQVGKIMAFVSIMIKIHKQQQDFVKHYECPTRTSNRPGVCAAAHVGSVSGNNQNSLKTYKAPVSFSAQLRLGKQIHGYVIFSFQCFDTVGWATGRHPACKKTGRWFVGGEDLTGASHGL